jgi:hypothetical protein
VTEISGKIRKISSSGVVTTLSHTFNSLGGITVSPSGEIFVLAQGMSGGIIPLPEQKLIKIGADESTMTQILSLSNLLNGLSEAVGIAMDSNGMLYVSEATRILKINPVTGQSIVFAGNGIAAFADGLGTAASFNGLKLMTVHGNVLYAADLNNQRIRKIILY